MQWQILNSQGESTTLRPVADTNTTTVYVDGPPYDLVLTYEQYWPGLAVGDVRTGGNGYCAGRAAQNVFITQGICSNLMTTAVSAISAIP